MAADFCCLLVFACLVVSLILFWVIFVSVVWMYVLQSLTEVAYFEYKFVKLLPEQFFRAELMGEINEIVQVSWWYFAWIHFVSSKITCILTAN